MVYEKNIDKEIFIDALEMKKEKMIEELKVIHQQGKGRYEKNDLSEKLQELARLKKFTRRAKNSRCGVFYFDKHC
jgi:hypothetical protein